MMGKTQTESPAVTPGTVVVSDPLKGEVQPDPKPSQRNNKASAAKTETTTEAPSLEALDKALAKAERELSKNKTARKTYVAAQEALAEAKKKSTAQGPHKAEMDKQREGYRAHRRAENQRRELRKQRAELYPKAS